MKFSSPTEWPIRIIKGPDTQLGASALTIDPVNNLLIVSGNKPRARGEGRGGGGSEEGDFGEGGEGGGRGLGQILIFNRTDNGNVKPLRVINSPMADGATLMTTYPPRGWILAAVKRGGRNSAAGNYVGVWSINDNGPVPPRWTIGGPNGQLRDSRGIAVDPKHKTVMVSDKYVNGVLTYEIPEIF